ncbi:hypothetical protein M5D96_007677 [Drosophila gunungcola]|uniref:WKF domain-containing protein n=1 Tax=Drosophila gunungcola TaxID=103775 RepID=A0A9P9YL34_9MUSC|nr:hypothetical protein M5D96_007677 [Drosophila gunungcola]
MARTELEKKAKRQGKKRKHEAAGNAENAASDDEVANKSLILEPQVEQQAAPTARPENSNAVVTVRQKKKQKHQQRLEAQKNQNTNKEAKINKEYLLKWKESRQEWKFIKLRQISIQQTAFDEEKLDADLWPTALEYLASSQGAARSKISELAEEVIQKLDKEGEKLDDEAERQKLIESTRYQRARDLLQSFD